MPTATITYRLSEAGRKAAIIAGQSGESLRKDCIEISASDLDVFSISSDGAITADLQDGTEVAEYGSGFCRQEFDAPLTAADAITWLRERPLKQEASKEAHRAKKAVAQAELDAKAAEAAAEKRAKMATLLLDCVAKQHCGNWLLIEGGVRRKADLFNSAHEFQLDDTDPAIAEAVIAMRDLITAQEAAEAEKGRIKSLLAALPSAATQLEASVQANGTVRFVVPEPSEGEVWAKHIQSVNTAAGNGMAFEGPWLKCGQATSLAAGELVVVGSKWWEGSRRNGSWKKIRGTYVVTAAGVIMAESNDASHAAHLLALPVQDRIVATASMRIGTCDAKIDELDAAAADEKYAECLSEIAELRTGWVDRKAALQRAIDTATAEPAITDPAEAALALISAGYRALSAKHHPDKGGSVEVMILINQAKESLVDLVKMAQGGAN